MFPRPQFYAEWRTWADALLLALENEEQKVLTIPRGEALPTPSKSQRGTLLHIIDPAGDEVHVCIWDGVGYSWKQLAP